MLNSLDRSTFARFSLTPILLLVGACCKLFTNQVLWHEPKRFIKPLVLSWKSASFNNEYTPSTYLQCLTDIYGKWPDADDKGTDIKTRAPHKITNDMIEEKLYDMGLVIQAEDPHNPFNCALMNRLLQIAHCAHGWIQHPNRTITRCHSRSFGRHL